jgi:hypothetical protein
LLLWTNLHASFTLAIGFAGALAIDAVLPLETTAQRLAAARRWGAFLLACVLVVMVNPRGIEALTHAAGVMNMTQTLALVNEWKSADFHDFQFLLLWLAMVMALAFAGRLRLSVIRVVFVLGLLYLALKHQRYHALLGLVSAFLLATPIGVGLRSLSTDAAGANADGLDRWFRRWSSRARPVGLGIALLLGVGYVMIGRGLMPSAPNRSTTPERALAAFQATGVHANVLNAYGLGGYLIFREVPVFIDGRADMYGDAFVAKAAEAMTLKAPHALENLLAKYQVGWTMLGPQSPAVELLDHLPQWKRVYADSIAVVHVRADLLDQATRPGIR